MSRDTGEIYSYLQPRESTSALILRYKKLRSEMMIEAFLPKSLVSYASAFFLSKFYDIKTQYVYKDEMKNPRRKALYLLRKLDESIESRDFWSAHEFATKFSFFSSSCRVFLTDLEKVLRSNQERLVYETRARLLEKYLS